MNEDALAFLERWIEENVAAVPADQVTERAEFLATLCVKDAAEAGISEEDLNEISIEAADGADLTSYLERALEQAALDESDEFGDAE